MEYRVEKATMSDLPRILEIYAYAREFMAKTGNPNQWGTTHPPIKQLEKDVQQLALRMDLGSPRVPRRDRGIRKPRNPVRTMDPDLRCRRHTHHRDTGQPAQKKTNDVFRDHGIVRRHGVRHIVAAGETV